MLTVPQSVSLLTLSTPNTTISFQASFLHPDSFISNLDLDYLGSLTNFTNLHSQNLHSFIIAHLTETTKDLLPPHFQSPEPLQILCSSIEDSFSSIFLILPKTNPYLDPTFFSSSSSPYILIKFPIKDLHSQNPSDLSLHIQNTKTSIELIKHKNAELYTQLQATSLQNSQKLQQKTELEQQNIALLSDLTSMTRRILELHKEFETLEKEEEEKCGIRLRCILCENNLKNVVFLPCGHLLICEECLVQNLKTEPNVVLERRRKCLVCQNCKAKVKEARIAVFT